MALEDDQKFALATFKRLIASFPPKLLKKEDAIASRLALSKLAPLKKLEYIYELVDEIGAYMAPATPCGKGCSACCHYIVTISDIEIRYIEKNTKHKRLKTLLPKQDYHGLPCPFLINNACSIYKARPFVCRRHHSLAPTPEWCAPEKSNVGEFTRLESSELKKAFDSVRAGTQPMDIRQVFGLQL